MERNSVASCDKHFRFSDYQLIFSREDLRYRCENTALVLDMSLRQPLKNFDGFETTLTTLVQLWHSGRSVDLGPESRIEPPPCAYVVIS